MMTPQAPNVPPRDRLPRLPGAVLVFARKSRVPGKLPIRCSGMVGPAGSEPDPGLSGEKSTASSAVGTAALVLTGLRGGEVERKGCLQEVLGKKKVLEPELSGF